MTFRKKLVLAGILQLVILALILFSVYIADRRASTREAFVQKARSIVLTTESTREQIAGNWATGTYSAEQLAQWAAQGDLKRVLQAVPVVNAWRAAMAKADEGGYEFRVPKFYPRNPKNEPDPLEARVLKLLESGDIPEYYEVDEQLNAVRYFRPIKLTQECLLCHGDPATSLTLWGNDDGLDPTGVKMENWNVGEVHGAFEVVQSLDEADAAIAASLKKGAAIVFAVVLVASLFLGWIITRLVNPVRDIVDGLNESAGQVGEASQQVADSATTLAEGASKQAASLEETSASLQELSSMSNTNAQNASEVNAIGAQTKQSAESCGQTVGRLNAAMAAIDESSQEIGKIVKVIEEIAFQTNLLALNAAVEAARAGEHGKGFAVVAEEVRGLALRSAEAVKDTTQLISNSTSKSAEGVQVAGDVAAGLNEIINHVSKVADLVAKITEASRKQAQGVDQINDAASQIDQVTQQNASASEESASASEQLSAQAQVVKEMVRRLASIVGINSA